MSGLVRLARSTLRSLRRKGPIPTGFAAARRVGVEPQGRYYYYRARLRAVRGERCTDPFGTIEVSPRAIEWLPTARFHKWRSLGDVRGGRWDDPLMRFEAMPTFRTLRQRFEAGREWEETELYRSALARLWRGKRGWHGSWTEDGLKARCDAVDDLYDRMSSEGYRSQADLTGKSTAERLRKGVFRRHEIDIAVHIGRDGEFRFVDGRHRLAIAKLLDLDTVTVQPVVRHRQWHETRRRVADRGIEAVSPELRQHPDLADVRD
ncbi:hypothetical protein ACFPM1_05905 [Halorubrum rubrum]|uniref:ParB/Sulfiredoxin domain-containing protein n=1 Tax=Halorubrum rubrum TaxID=1126240 RepID=A0ABD5R001_9EURY|nr:hypothetical protein [Halorubrum rubrum]